MSGLFKSAPLPKIEDPAPLPDEKQTTAARKRRIASETKSSGVQSTLLTAGGRETLGS